MVYLCGKRNLSDPGLLFILLKGRRYRMNVTICLVACIHRRHSLQHLDKQTNQELFMQLVPQSNNYSIT